MDKIDVAVIGSGVVGAAVSYDLRLAGANVVVLEAENDVAAGASRSNSGILHTGFDSPQGELETKLILDHGQRWPKVFHGLGIPYRRSGAVVVAHSDAEEAQLVQLASNAAKNGVEARLLSGGEMASKEPSVPAKAGLFVPGETITDPYEVVRGLLSVGQEIRLACRAKSVVAEDDGATILLEGGALRANYVINCAGLYADDFSDGEFNVTPRKGEFLVFPREAGSLINSALLPVPECNSKGILVFPTLHGHICVGPTAEDIEDKEDWGPRKNSLMQLQKKATEVVPALADFQPVNAWAGLRTVGHPRNYSVQFSKSIPSLLHVFGIRSTGMSSCLGLSMHVLRLLESKGLQIRPGKSYTRRPVRSDTPWWERLNTLRGVQPSF